MFFGSLSSVNLLECVSMNNQKCKIRPEIVNVNNNDPAFYPCSGSCNNFNDPYPKLCVADVVKEFEYQSF